MAIHSLTGNQTTNQYGGNIVCQGPTLTISPFTTFEQITLSLIGIIMKHLTIQQMQMMMVYQIIQEMYFSIRKNYSGTNKDSYALNFGISATFSIPLDRGLQNQCKSLLIHRFLYKSKC